MYSAFTIAFKITLLGFETEVANMFNDFFTQMIFFCLKFTHNPIENAIYKYENHLSVVAIKNYMKGTNSLFSFQTVTKENMAKLTTNLCNGKAVQSADIPSNLVKEFGCLFSSFIQKQSSRGVL